MTKNRKLGYFSRKQRKLLLTLYSMFKENPNTEITIQELSEKYEISELDIFEVIGFIRVTNEQALTA